MRIIDLQEVRGCEVPIEPNALTAYFEQLKRGEPTTYTDRTIFRLTGHSDGPPFAVYMIYWYSVLFLDKPRPRHSVPPYFIRYGEFRRELNANKQLLISLWQNHYGYFVLAEYYIRRLLEIEIQQTYARDPVLVTA